MNAISEYSKSVKKARKKAKKEIYHFQKLLEKKQKNIVKVKSTITVLKQQSGRLKLKISEKIEQKEAIEATLKVVSSQDCETMAAKLENVMEEVHNMSADMVSVVFD